MHFFSDFGGIFGCSDVSAFPKSDLHHGQPLNLAYVHQFMGLNKTHLGHFINQLTMASTLYGYSTDEASKMAQNLNYKFNVRCAPADADGQLNSLCQAPVGQCDNAVPSIDCAAYDNLRPEIGTSTPSSSSSSSLSGGAIAGIVIGAVVAVLLAVGGFLFWRRRRNNKNNNKSTPDPQQSQPPQMEHVFNDDGHGGYLSPSHPSYTPTNASLHHTSYAGTVSPSMMTFRDSHFDGGKVELDAASPPGSPFSVPPHSPKPLGEIAEMRGSDVPPGYGSSPPPAETDKEHVEGRQELH